MWPPLQLPLPAPPRCSAGVGTGQRALPGTYGADPRVRRAGRARRVSPCLHGASFTCSEGQVLERMPCPLLAHGSLCFCLCFPKERGPLGFPEGGPGPWGVLKGAGKGMALADSRAEREGRGRTLEAFVASEECRPAGPGLRRGRVCGDSPCPTWDDGPVTGRGREGQASEPPWQTPSTPASEPTGLCALSEPVSSLVRK